jgi:hypothetical protein
MSGSPIGLTGHPLADVLVGDPADSFGLRVNGAWDQAVYATISTPLGAGKVMDLSEEQLENTFRTNIVEAELARLATMLANLDRSQAEIVRRSIQHAAARSARRRMSGCTASTIS